MAEPDYTKPIKFTPIEGDAERLEYLRGRVGQKLAGILRAGLVLLERTERRKEAAEKGAQTRAVRA